MYMYVCMEVRVVMSVLLCIMHVYFVSICMPISIVCIVHVLCVHMCVHVHACMYVYHVCMGMYECVYLPNHSTMSRMGHNTRSIFLQSFADQNSGFFFSWSGYLTMVKESVWSIVYPGRRRDGLLPLLWVLEWWEAQVSWSRIWTWVV